MTREEAASGHRAEHLALRRRRTWWAEFNVSGPEIDYFRKFVEAGQPALDVACGTGRLLIPYLRAGLDVDGCDLSDDMLTLCRARAEAEGLSPNLHRQAMHRLELPRRYRTILVCGSFGLGGHRDHDLEALQCFYKHLEPGGTLILDNEVRIRTDRTGDTGRRMHAANFRKPGPHRGIVGAGPMGQSTS